MFCNQCEQTAHGVACTSVGVCGKNPEVSALQELVMHEMVALSLWAAAGGALGITDRAVDELADKAIFHTVTNVDFDAESLAGVVRALHTMRVALAAKVTAAGGAPAHDDPSLAFEPAADLAGIVAQAEAVGHFADRATDADVRSLMEVTIYGVKGIAAYADHARVLGHSDPDVSSFTYKAFASHGEMLPAHGYPELKKYPHLYGNYGTAWQNQRKEFAEFPGAILMTTNCIQAPRDSYLGNIFTTGNVEWPGAVHVANGDFSQVIERALALPGFTDTQDAGSVMVGFARDAVLSVAPTVIEAVKSGAIRHFFLVGGCDGAKPGRSYYTDFVDESPSDTIILTLACGKFRFFDHKIGEIGGIPRLLDVGQCNDAYSAVRIAMALADAFGVGVNELPLSIILSWYEQKAVAVLLTLLHLGITGIRLGPTLPGFITPNVLQVLVDNFAIKPIGETAKADLDAILGAA